MCSAACCRKSKLRLPAARARAHLAIRVTGCPSHGYPSHWLSESLVIRVSTCSPEGQYDVEAPDEVPRVAPAVALEEELHLHTALAVRVILSESSCPSHPPLPLKNSSTCTPL